MNNARFDFDGRSVLVTGGTSGIGAGIALEFANAGASIAITGTRASATEYDSDLSSYTYHRLAMTDNGAIEALASKFGSLDVLVNNAGCNMPGGKSELAADVFEESVQINLFGHYRLATACKASLMQSRLDGGASIINLASLSAYFAIPAVPGYSAAKAATVLLTKNLASAWAADGIRVNAIAPGYIETNMTKFMKKVPQLETPMLARTPLQRWGTPEDIAQPVLFLASSSARFITGQTLLVDGGYSVA